MLLVVLSMVALFGYAVQEVVPAPPIRSVGLITTPPKPPSPIALAHAGPLPTERFVYRRERKSGSSGCSLGEKPRFKRVLKDRVALVNLREGDFFADLGFRDRDILWTVNDSPIFTEGLMCLYEAEHLDCFAIRYERKGRVRVKLIEFRD